MSSSITDKPCIACGLPRKWFSYSEGYTSGAYWNEPCQHCPSGHGRMPWPEYFKGIAIAVSARASCPRDTVGAVIVDAYHRVIATGYNGAAPGEDECVEVGCRIEDGHCQRANHAEVNALADAAARGVSVRGCTMYLYRERFPDLGVCRECDKLVRAVGLYKVEVV